ncbi:flagellar hook-length control protein FliK [Thiomonas intermedia]|uniref:flagellar hook-length control protein FliK n=1 Tax=Thiomonas intermedia TaxID=926 RepID=UPI0009A4A1C7|nr:flagellar hook-length control protein FliK [Thiomonas intermedia]
MSLPPVLSGVATVSPVGSTGPARAESGAFSAAPGTAFEAEVVQVQPVASGASAAAGAAADGRMQTQVMLRLGNALVAATLPGTAPQVGSRLPLIYLGSQNGQAQFLLAPQQGQTAAVQAQLSGPGQLLGLLQQMQAASVSQAGAGAAGAPGARSAAATPVWPDPTMPTPQAAQRLAGALSDSGLFYESHLGAWAQGQQPLSVLLAQPQGRLSPLLQTTPAPQTTASPSATPNSQPSASTATSTASPAPQMPDVVPIPRHAALAAYSTVQSGPQVASDPAALASRLPAELHGVVQQQLQALMQGQVIWEGLLWPGQTARWSLRPDPEDRGRPQTPAERPWSTQIDLDLPQLGPVQARLRLDGHRVDVVLRHDTKAQERVDAALPQLRRALQTAGLEVGVLQLDRSSGGEPA